MKPIQPQVLIVDSDPKDVRVLLEVLETAAIDVHVRTNSRSALEAFHEIKPDLVLVDSRMRSGNGKRVSAELAQADQGRPIPVILMTEEDATGAAGPATALDAGGCALQLQKPLTRQDLLDTLSRFLPKAFLAKSSGPQTPRPTAPTMRPDPPGAAAQPESASPADEKVLGSLLDKVFPTSDAGDLASAIVQQVRPGAREPETIRATETRPKSAPLPSKRSAPAARDASAPLADLPVDTIDAMLESIFPTGARREPPVDSTGTAQQSAVSSPSAKVATAPSAVAEQPAPPPVALASPPATVEEPAIATPSSPSLETVPIPGSPVLAPAEPAEALPCPPAEPAQGAGTSGTVSSAPLQEPGRPEVEAATALAMEPITGAGTMTIDSAPVGEAAPPEPAQAAPTPVSVTDSPVIAPVRSAQDELPAPGTTGSGSAGIAETGEPESLGRARGSKRDKKARKRAERDEAMRTGTKNAQAASFTPAAAAPTVAEAPSAAAFEAASETASEAAATSTIPLTPDLGKGLEQAEEKPRLTVPRRRTGRILATAGIGLAACAAAFFVMSRNGVQRAPQGPATLPSSTAGLRPRAGSAPASSAASSGLTQTPSQESLPSLPAPRETGRAASSGEPTDIVAPAEHNIALPQPGSPPTTASPSRAALTAVLTPAPRATAPAPTQASVPGPASTPPAPVSRDAVRPAPSPLVSSESATGGGAVAAPGSLSGAGMVRHSPGSSTAPTAPSTDIAQTQMERAASAASEGASPAPAASGGTAGEPLARLTMIRSAEGAAAQEGERGNPFAGDVVPFASPAPLRHAPPDYPSVAVSMRQTGSVRLLVKVESDGRVTEVRVTGHATPVLDQAAVNAAYGWSYKPAQQNGQPVATWVEETVEFRLR